MIRKRYQVFVSSTFLDLQEEREEVFRAILDADCIPIGMEMFPAGNEEKWEVIRRVLDDSDYYILILGDRYGSTTAAGISWTEREFDYALAHGIPTCVCPRKAPVPKRRLVGRSQRSRAAQFRARVLEKNRGIERYWTTLSNLSVGIGHALNSLKQRPRDGWVRGNRAEDLEHADLIPATARQIATSLNEIDSELTRAAGEFSLVRERLNRFVDARFELRNYSTVLGLKASLPRIYRITVQRLLDEPLQVLDELAAAQLHVDASQIEATFRLLLSGIELRYDGVSSSDLKFWHEPDGRRYLQAQGHIAAVFPTTRVFVLPRKEFTEERKAELESILALHMDYSIGWAVAFREDIPVPLEQELDFGLFDGTAALSFFFRRRPHLREFDVVFHTGGKRRANDAEIEERVKIYEMILRHALIVDKRFTEVHLFADDATARSRLKSVATARKRRVTEAGLDQADDIFPIVISDETDLRRGLDDVLRIDISARRKNDAALNP